MLKAHSLLWHYLWVAPNIYLLALGLVSWRRGLRLQIPAFIAFAIISACGQLAVYGADIAPAVTPANFWRVDWASLCVESLLKFLIIGEIFSRVFDPYPSVSKLGRYLVSTVGVVLIFFAALVAAMSQGDSTVRLISGAHLLELTVFIIQTGLILSIFLLAGYFRMPLDRYSFGILVGFGLASCVHVATWAAMNNFVLSAHQRTLLDFVNMATYHVTIVLWCYYVLVPGREFQFHHRKSDSGNRTVASPSPSLAGAQDHEERLKDWNRELERLIHS
jgi:hypothetical protein